ncbi:MAG: phosphotransferase [Candidatus Izemoplasmatales bacterium]|jgi:thiamine kinase-like enzyme
MKSAKTQIKRVFKPGVFLSLHNGKKVIQKDGAILSPRQFKTERTLLRFLSKKPAFGASYEYDYTRKMLFRKAFFGKKTRKFTALELRSTARKIAKLHGIVFPKYGRIGIKDQPRQRGTFNDAFNHYLQLISSNAETNLIDSQIRGSIQKIISNSKKIAQREKSLTQSSFSLIHRDLHNNNLIFSKRGPKIIDWGSAATWDPALDIALFYVKNNLPMKRFEIFMSEYCKHSPDKNIKSRVRLYVPLARLTTVLFENQALLNQQVLIALKEQSSFIGFTK